MAAPVIHSTVTTHRDDRVYLDRAYRVQVDGEIQTAYDKRGRYDEFSDFKYLDADGIFDTMVAVIQHHLVSAPAWSLSMTGQTHPPALRSEIETALADLISNEEGMRFQCLAVVLAKQRWPEFIACERKKDMGLDAHASSSLAPDKTGKGLACSITAEVEKILADAAKVRQNFPDVTVLVFSTPAKVSNPKKKEWAEKIHKDFGYELHVVSREDIIASLMEPRNGPLCRSFLSIDVAVDAPIVEVVDRIRQAAGSETVTWLARTRGQPLIELLAAQMDDAGNDSRHIYSLDRVHEALAESRRLVLEAPAGRGKTTTLTLLAGRRTAASGTAFLVDLPGWVSSRLTILEFIARSPSFQARGIGAATLAQAQASEHFAFLLNGWNEITESNSIQAVEALRELERSFPAAGIIVATRTHHIAPPLPGAVRLRLLLLTRRQRDGYLRARLGDRARLLGSQLDADSVLDEVTRTPLILSGVTSVFEAGAPIPNTKIGVLGAIIRLIEESPEHSAHLITPPLSGRQHDYLGELAMQMTPRGSVSVADSDARAIVHAVASRLRDERQIIALPEPAAVLAALCAHHVLERIEYPAVEYRFEHQQFQEHYAAVDIKRRLLQLMERNVDAQRRDFTATYVNAPAWAEPLRMVAETFSIQVDEQRADPRQVQAGRALVELALSVDPIFAGELGHLCGTLLWREVGRGLHDRLRSWYAVHDEHHRHCALAAMLATGSDEFRDIIIPLLAGEQHARLGTYRLWSEFHPTSLGANWRDEVSSWDEDARTSFVAEILQDRFVPDVVSFALGDKSLAVQKAAVDGLTWNGLEDEAARFMEATAATAFDAIAREMPPDFVPAAIRSKALAALQSVPDDRADPGRRLATLLKRAELGEPNIADLLKSGLDEVPDKESEKWGHYAIRQALDILRAREPEWVSHWVAARVANGALYPPHWMPLVSTVSDELAENCLRRLESEDFKNSYFGGMIAVLVVGANDRLAARVFSDLRELRRTINAAPDQRHDCEWQIERQLETLFQALPIDVSLAGLLAALSDDQALDLEVLSRLLSRVARTESESIRAASSDLKAALRAYTKKGLPVVLGQDDFRGELKANVASVLAQVGEPDDIDDLATLVQADIERVTRGRGARAAGKRDPAAEGSSVSYAPWHVRAVVELNAPKTDALLLDLLRHPEYELPVAEEMARLAVPKKPEALFAKVDYNKIWEARAGRIPRSPNEEQRARFAGALREQIARLLDERRRHEQTRPFDHRLKELAKHLAAIDAQGSADLVLEVISLPGEWDGWQRVDAAERLLFGGVVLPSGPTLALLDSFLELSKKHGLQDQERWLLKRFLCVCSFVDSPPTGIRKIRDILAGQKWFPPYELRDVATAVGHSRCDEALDLLLELAADRVRAEQMADAWTNAVAALDTPAARNLLLSFVDPAIPGLPLEILFNRQDVLAARIFDCARRDPAIEARLRELCAPGLPAPKRSLLSKVMNWLGTPEAVLAGLNLLDDRAQPPIEFDTWQQLYTAFVEHKPYGQSPNTFTLAARASNEIRARLFDMAARDDWRKKSAFSLLGQIEEWRLEHGRPIGEPRHPAFGSADPWPPVEPQ